MIYQFEHGETTSCEWCEPKTIPLFYAECVRATIDDESQLISVNYCPNCGRRLKRWPAGYEWAGTKSGETRTVKG